MYADWEYLQPNIEPVSSGKKNKNRRRFSDEQIKSLEVMFKSGSRPETRTKQQLASELGLEPRQVAIWFQNRRSRSKIRQIEREYIILKASYDALASDLESLKKENQSLLIQLQKLKSLQEKATRRRNQGSGEAGKSNSSDIKSKYGDTMCESKEHPNLLLEGYNHQMDVSTSDGNSRYVECTREDTEFLNMAETTYGSLRLSRDWCSFESSSFLDESISSSEWWELLS